jgi:hypothetical protein
MNGHGKRSRLIQQLFRDLTTFGGQDSVVLYSIPTDVFIYDAWTPNEDGSGWSMSEMEVRLPYQPVTSVVEASAYDKIAAQYPEILPVVGGAILKHTLGQPATYPQTTGGLTGCLTGSEWSGVSGGSGQRSAGDRHNFGKYEKLHTKMNGNSPSEDRCLMLKPM